MNRWVPALGFCAGSDGVSFFLYAEYIQVLFFILFPCGEKNGLIKPFPSMGVYFNGILCRCGRRVFVIFVHGVHIYGYRYLVPGMLFLCVFPTEKTG